LTPATLAAAATALLAVGVLFWWAGRQWAPRPDEARPPVRFTVVPPPGNTFGGDYERTYLALSPDGSRLAFVAADASHVTRIWLRPMSSPDAQSIAGTEGARSLFWSPDGKSIAFFADNKLKRIDPSEGSALTVCNVSKDIGLAGTWGSEEILFASIEGDAIYSVPVSTAGIVTALVSRDVEHGVTRVQWPAFLPDGKRYFYLARQRDGSGQLMLGARGRAPRPVMKLESAVQWVDPGYLIYAREGALIGQRFDAASEQTVGAAIDIANSVEYSYSTARAMFTASRNGVVAYEPRRDPPRAHLSWFDRSGVERNTAAPTGVYRSFKLSPDDRSLLFDRPDLELGTFDLWMRDLVRGTERRITFDPSSENLGVWLRDGNGIVYSADRGGPPHLYYRDLSTGADRELLPVGRFQQALDISGDGTSLLFAERAASGSFDLKQLSLGPGSVSVRAVTDSPFDEPSGWRSADGRLLAFVSNESGLPDWYVAPIDRLDAKRPIASSEVLDVRWGRGTEAVYLTSDGEIYSTTVAGSTDLAIAPPKLLFKLKTRWLTFGLSADGSRFLALIPDQPSSRKPMVVVLNGLSARTP
jgi:Tol biopolymer transport system component